MNNHHMIHATEILIIITKWKEKKKKIGIFKRELFLLF